MRLAGLTSCANRYTAHFVNALSKLPVGAAGEHMLVFYDCYSLEDGQQFDDSFMRGLANAHVRFAAVVAFPS